MIDSEVPGVFFFGAFVDGCESIFRIGLCKVLGFFYFFYFTAHVRLSRKSAVNLLFEV